MTMQPPRTDPRTVRWSGLGVAGVDETLRALELGEVELMVDAAVAESAERRANAGVDEWTANELMSPAVRTDAPIACLPDHSGLRELGAVGALLRFRA